MFTSLLNLLVPSLAVNELLFSAAVAAEFLQTPLNNVGTELEHVREA